MDKNEGFTNTPAEQVDPNGFVDTPDQADKKDNSEKEREHNFKAEEALAEQPTAQAQLQTYLPAAGKHACGRVCAATALTQW